MSKMLQAVSGRMLTNARVLMAKAGVALHGLWLAAAWVATSAVRGRLKALAVAVMALMLTPGLAQAQSALCSAINAGAFDQATTYSAGAVTSTNSRETIGTNTFSGILTPGWTGATTSARWYGGGASYAYIPGETINISVVANASAGTLRGSLYRGNSSSTVGGLIQYIEATGSFSYTLPATEYVIDARLQQTGSATGTISMTATCTPAPPSISNIAPTQGPTAGGTNVTLTGSNFTSGTVTVDGSTVTPTMLSDTSVTFTTPAHAAGVVSVALNTPGGTATTNFTYVAPPTVTSVSPTSGPTGGGQTVTITGTNFSNAAAVTFGATAATGFTVNSNTQITATAPANAAGTYDVRVTTVGGTSAASAADQYTYVAAPTVTAVSPTSGPTGGGQTVIITGTGFAFANPTGAVRFGATNATYTINSNTQITATSPANAAGTYDVTVTTPGGTSATSAADQYTYVQAPTVTAVSPTSGPTVGGTTVIITGSGFAFANPTGAVKFGATNATYTINSNTQITATSPANAAGTYDVTVTTAGGTSATSAADQFTYVSPPISSSQTYGSIVAYNDGSNQTTNLDLNWFLTGGGTPTSFAVGSATTAQGGSISVDSAGQATYTPPVGFRNANDSFTWTASNAGGTSSPATVTITVGNPTFSVTLPAITATVGADYNAGAAPVSVSGGRSTYTINSISGLPSGLTDAGGGVISGTPSADGVYTVSVNITDSSLGAGPYTSNASATLTVVLPPPPVASAFTAPSVAYNTGSAPAVTFSAASHATNNPTGYAVGSATTANGGSVSIDSSGLVSYTPPTGFRGNDSFTFSATNQGGTSAPATVTVPVSNPVFAITLPAATGVVGAAYNSGGAPVTVSGGRAPYGSFSATGLPAGLTLSSTGILSGTPTTATNATIMVTLTDSSTGTGPYTSSASASLTIAAPTITLSPASGALPGATAGVNYSQTFTSSGGVAPITYAVTAGVLPSGLALATNGSLSGTPTSTGTYNFTVTGTDSSGNNYTGSASYSITVSGPTISIAPSLLPNAQVGVSYSQTLTASAGTAPYTFALDTGALPAGVTLSTGGVLSGAATEGGSFAFTVRATDSTSGGNYSGTQAYVLSVGAPSIVLGGGALTSGTVGVAYSETLSASGGTAGYSYQVTAGSLPPGLTLSTGGAITGTSSGGGTYNFTVTATDSSSGSGPYMGAGAYSITMGAPAITVAPGSVSNAQIGVAYSQTFTTSGGTAGYTYAITAGALPAGLSLNSATGVLSGTPTAAGSFSYTVESTDSSTGLGAPFTGSRTYSMNVLNPALTLTPSTLTGMTVGAPFTATITAGGGTAPWNYFMYGGTVLPAGLSLNATTGEITGTPTAGGSFSFTIAATDSSTGVGAPFTVARAYNVTVGAPAVTITTVTLPAGQVASAYSQTVAASGGTAPYTFAVTAGALPPGLTISSGVISGTPTAQGTYNFTLTATDSSTGTGPYTGAQAYALFIGLPTPPVAGPVSLTVGYNSSNEVVTPALSGAPANSVAVAAQPAHGTVTVSGLTFLYTPTSGHFGADSFTYTATNDGGTSAPATVSITVSTPPAPTVSGVSGVAIAYNSTGTVIDLTSSVGGVYSAVTVGTQPAHGTASITGTTATYTPAANYFGADSFTFIATGPGGSSAPATVSVTVATPPPPVVTPPTDPVVVTPPAGGGASQPVTVSLGSSVSGVTDDFRIGTGAQNGTATITGDGSAGSPWTLNYTPAANFMGTDTVSVIASGPGGDSAPATFTFQVPGKAPDLSASVLSNASVTISPTAGLVGGPFSAVRITGAPAFGTATVSGLNIVFTPGAANGGSTFLTYVIDLPFGTSAAGRIDLTSNLVPGAQTLTAQTLQGVPVTTRISNTVGGPFTAAAVVAINPTTAGTATVSGSGANWDLTFTPAATFSGQAVVTFTLSNTFGTSTGALTVTVAARPDPSQNVEVRGVASAQVTSAARFADAQINNFQRRLERLHSGQGSGFSNGLSFNVGFGGEADLDNDPRQALRRELGIQDKVEPGARDDRSREMLGLDIWAGRQNQPDAVNGETDRLGAVPAASGDGRPASTVGFWTAGSVDWGRQDAAGQRDYRFTTQGITAGLDFRLSDTLVVGGGVGYGEDKTKIGDNGSVSNGKAWTGALYASWLPAESFYFDGVVGLADLDFDARRWVSGLAGQPDGYADSDRSGDVRFVSAAFGRLMRSETMVTNIYARVDASEITLDGFTETGGGLGALIWDEIEQSSLSANLGASWRWTVDTRRFGRITPSARLEWSHELEDVGSQGVRYADWAASPTYLVPLDAWSRNALNIDLGAEWSLTDRMMFSLGYRGNLGDASTSHGAEIRFKYGW